MCLAQEKSDGSKSKMPNSPWRRIMKQHFKPKLSRSVVSCAKINLNRYWSKFEQLSNSKSSLMTFHPINGPETQSNYPQPMIPHQSSQTEDNEVNDNIYNEIVEIDFNI